MADSRMSIEKRWKDRDFFEVHLRVRSDSCQACIDFYTTNEELEKLRNGMQDVANVKRQEFVWISGEDREQVTHYLKLRLFMYDRRGIIGIEVVMDNKLESPFGMRAAFGLQAEIGQIDDFTQKLAYFIQEKVDVIEAL
ncbi:hypothetical protein [Metabacillus iocasae]|uniref:Uncharacterized protein n=1 Tax=Priestia iocasae TaxID=2291674 RepID=A0ABS2QUL3_9BACI|nr:hypothetical protein [Metabacillus iocasae]MBM7702888.1 hypothetical protein [Metabacillus iocasae]